MSANYIAQRVLGYDLRYGPYLYGFAALSLGAISSSSDRHEIGVASTFWERSLQNQHLCVTQIILPSHMRTLFSDVNIVPAPLYLVTDVA